MADPRFIENLENTSMWVHEESWALTYTKDEIAPASGGGGGSLAIITENETEDQKKARLAKEAKQSKSAKAVPTTAKLILNRGKEETKPAWDTIKECFYVVKKAGDASGLWGPILADTADIRKNYSSTKLVYQADRDYDKLITAITDGDEILVLPVNEQCMAGYNISSETQTQQFTNSCGTFIRPLKQKNLTAQITAYAPKPFDEDKKSFSWILFNNNIDLAVQEEGVLTEFRKAKMYNLTFIFLVYPGNTNYNEMATILSFNGQILNNTLSTDVSSQSTITIDTPVSVKGGFQLLNHDLYTSELLV